MPVTAMALPEGLDPELRLARLRDSLRRGARRVEQARPLTAEGRLVRMVGLTLEAEGCACPWVDVAGW